MREGESDFERGRKPKEERIFKKRDIANVLIKIKDEKEAKDSSKSLYPGESLIHNQVEKAAKELQEESPERYRDISSKIKHDRNEVEAILGRLEQNLETGESRKRRDVVKKRLQSFIEEARLRLFEEEDEEK